MQAYPCHSTLFDLIDRDHTLSQVIECARLWQQQLPLQFQPWGSVHQPHLQQQLQDQAYIPALPSVLSYFESLQTLVLCAGAQHTVMLAFFHHIGACSYCAVGLQFCRAGSCYLCPLLLGLSTPSLGCNAPACAFLLARVPCRSCSLVLFQRRGSRAQLPVAHPPYH